MSPRSRIVPAAVAGVLLWTGGSMQAPAYADALKSRLQAVEDDLSRNREKRDQLGRAAKKAANELKEIQKRGIALARSLYRYSARADKLQDRLRQLQDLEQQGVETVVCLGDVIGYGASPREVIELVRTRFDICLQGNHDAAVAGQLDLRWFNPFAARSVRWTRSRTTNPSGPAASR